jgi:hypothetical protein
MRIISTDNFCRDYPVEHFLNIPALSKKACNTITKAINDELPPDHPNFYKVVENDYKLEKGFEP